MEQSNKLRALDDLSVRYSLAEAEKEAEKHENPIKKVIRLLLLNGYLLPAGESKIVSLNDPKPKNFFGAKRVLFYDETTQKGMVLRRSWIKMVSIYMGFLRLTVKYAFRHSRIQKQYRNRVNEITSMEFWERYLKM